MFNNFTKRGPTIKPVESQCWHRDTRPAPHSVHAGVYTPVLGKAPRIDAYALPALDLPAPKKPRGTV
jgi:hypothetical protein